MNVDQRDAEVNGELFCHDIRKKIRAPHHIRNSSQGFLLTESLVDVLLNTEEGSHDVATARFATVDSSQPFQLPVRKLSDHHVRGCSFDSLISGISSLSGELTAATIKFRPIECGQPLHLPRRKLTPHHIATGSMESINSFLSASARFATATCDQPLNLPQHPLLRQGIINIGMMNDKIIQESSPFIDGDTDNLNQVCIFNCGKVVDSVNREELNSKEKFFFLNDQDDPLYIPMRQSSLGVGSIFPESPSSFVDSRGVSRRFSMADFEDPIHVPLRKRGFLKRNSSLDSLTDDDTVESSDIED